METRGLQSSEVKNSLIQDNCLKIQVVGSDVEALYPSLEAIEVAQIVYKSIMESEVKFRGVDYQEACRLALPSETRTTSQEVRERIQARYNWR